MARKLCVLFLALALTAGLTAPAGAYYLMDDGYTIYPNEESYQFWEKNRFILKDQEIFEESADDWNFCGEFHEGLVLVSESVTVPPEEYPGLNPNYIDKNGKLVDLNRNRYWLMYPFFEGLAAAELKRDKNGEAGVAYIDTQGNEVVPLNKEWMTYRTSSVSIVYYTGRFENGKAVVMRERQNPTWDEWAGHGFEYAYIDKKGNYLTGWAEAKDKNTIISLPLYDQNGIWIGFREDPAAWAANAISYEQLYKGGSEADGGEQNPTQPFTPEYHAPELPDYNADAPSLFASTAKVTGFHLGDLDFGSAEVTITNPGTVTDAGVVAAVFANVDDSNFAGDGDGVFFIPYELAPGESRAYSVNMRGIFNQGMFAPNAYQPYAEQLAGHVFSTLFTFSDDADLLNFYDTVPYEQHWYPQTIVNEFQPICDGQPGTDWLLGVAGISRRAADLEHYEYYLPDGGRLNAAKADHHTYCGY